jgi:hypothetical protein
VGAACFSNGCARPTARYRFYLHADQTAELGDAHGRLVSGREPLYGIGKLLDDYGYGMEDLVPE